MVVIIFPAWQGDVRRKVNLICSFLLQCELRFGMVFHLHNSPVPFTVDGMAARNFTGQSY